MKRGERGVTLIELAVVMAIVAIIALFMAPAFGAWLDNFRIRQAARELSSDFQFIKMKAINTGRYCSIVFNQDVSGTRYAYVIFPDYDNDLVLDTADAGDLDGDGDQENETMDIFKPVLLARHVVFDSSQGSGDGVTFLNNSNGQPAIAFDGQGFPKRAGGAFGAGTVYLKHTNNNRGRKVAVSSAGRIKIEEYQP
jgi:prepilin-type N-terminal cleavage/methylation domain-containing protein